MAVDRLKDLKNGYVPRDDVAINMSDIYAGTDQDRAEKSKKMTITEKY